jgi:hypothetical protein
VDRIGAGGGGADSFVGAAVAFSATAGITFAAFVFGATSETTLAAAGGRAELDLAGGREWNDGIRPRGIVIASSDENGSRPRSVMTGLDGRDGTLARAAWTGRAGGRGRGGRGGREIGACGILDQLTADAPPRHREDDLDDDGTTGVRIRVREPDRHGRLRALASYRADFFSSTRTSVRHASFSGS